MHSFFYFYGGLKMQKSNFNFIELAKIGLNLKKDLDINGKKCTVIINRVK